MVNAGENEMRRVVIVLCGWLSSIEPCKKSGHSDTQFIHLFVVEIIFYLH